MGRVHPGFLPFQNPITNPAFQKNKWETLCKTGNSPALAESFDFTYSFVRL
jgi:hypothetical protein